MKACVERPDRQAGQSLVIFALILTVFIGFCALVVDVGRMYAERRYMQNAADAGVLAASGLVANSIMPCTVGKTETICTNIKRTEVVLKAQTAATANASLLGGYSQPVDVVVRFKQYDTNKGRCDTSPWTDSNILQATTDLIPVDTCKLRVEATSHWDTWFPFGIGAGFGKHDAEAGAGATAMIVGDNSLTPRGDVWPMIRRRSALDPFSEIPERGNPFQFWSSSAANHLDDAGNNWKELVNLGYYSQRPGTGSPGYSLISAPRIQAIQGAESYKNGQPDGWRTGQTWFGKTLANKSNNGGPNWETKSNQASPLTAPYMSSYYQQDGENWFDYGFGGYLSLLKDWSGYSCTTPGVPCELPSNSDFKNGHKGIKYDLSTTGNNNNTLNASWWHNGTGDWVETYNGGGYGGGDIGNNVHSQIMEYISRNGRSDCPFSGPPTNYGKCVTIAVYMWEGAQIYYPNGGNYWLPWNSLHGTKDNGNGVPDRVHVVDFWYFVFYEGIANAYPTSEIDGFFVSKGEIGSPPFFNTPPGVRQNFYFMVSE